jgi:hypothetical protein
MDHEGMVHVLEPIHRLLRLASLNSRQGRKLSASELAAARSGLPDTRLPFVG